MVLRMSLVEEKRRLQFVMVVGSNCFSRVLLADSCPHCGSVALFTFLFSHNIIRIPPAMQTNTIVISTDTLMTSIISH